MPRVPVGGSELQVERRGDGDPLLLIQGLGGDSTHWGEAFLDELSGDFEVIVYDHRGTGGSGPCGAVTTAGLAVDALAVLDALEIERAHVFGFSMGGMVAQELALRSPDRIATLTLAATSAGGTQSKPTGAEVAQALTAAVLSGDRERVLRTSYGLLFGRAFAAVPANYEPFAASARGSAPPIAVLREQLSAVLAHDAYGRLRGLDLPTLVVHGTGDQILESVNGELIASLIAGARLELLEGVGHMLFWEQPERVAQLVGRHAAA
ncbi:MAG: alpha/beta fold hydrolase [Solirubrobacteraceae bacterium]